MCLSTSSRRFHHNKPGIGAKRSADAVVAHGARSRISGSPTTFRKALQKGMSRG
jgi:hypothetical protein